MADLGELLVKVRSEGADDTAQEVQDAAQQGTEDGGDGLLSGLLGDGLGGITEGLGGGGGISGLLGSMSGLMAGILGGIGAILGVLLTMEPIQKMLSSFMKIIQAFFLPLAKAVIKVMTPVMKALMKLLPKWLSFWSDPIGNIKKALKFVWDALKSIVPGLISGLFSLPSMIWSLFKSGLSSLFDLGGSAGTPGDEKVEGRSRGIGVGGQDSSFTTYDPVPSRVEARTRGIGVDTREFRVPNNVLRDLRRMTTMENPNIVDVVVDMDPDQRELYGIKVMDPNNEVGGR